ncbi:MAG: carbohydrate-binding domain-containing protein [Clostridia bacterium]|nr:carbohydrate-binding domain-containing protein [Clostridia bacterium]
MKRFFAIWILAALLCTACGAPNTSSSASTDASPVSSAAAQASAASGAVPEALNDPTDASKETTETFSVTSDDGEISPDGSVYTITAAGDYTVTGALSDGQIVVNAGGEDEVKLILDNASISCSTGAPILVLNAGKATVKAEKDSYNTVADLRAGSADSLSGSEENYDAAIWAACDLNLSGSGTLIVTTGFDNGVKSKDDLKIKNLTLKVTACGNALKGNDSVEIQSGELILISTASDGVKTENSDVSSKGNHRGTVTISGGQVDVYAACDAISAAYNVEISEEETCVVNLYTASYASEAAEAASSQEMYLIVPVSLYSDDYRYYAYLYNDDETDGVWAECTYDTMVYSGRRASYYGLVFRVPDGYQNILFQIVDGGAAPDGSNYAASTGGETVNTSMNGYLIGSVSGTVISGDWVQLSSGSGSNKTTFSSKGIKAANEVVINGGTVTIFAMDDGVHANGGDALEDGTTGGGNITVSGGTVTITSADDGMHADNALTVNGGTIRVAESHEGLEANVLTQNGGTVFVYANDDGLNAAAGSATPMVIINGGYAEIVTSSGDTDAIDSNGSFLMTGGTVLVLGGSSQGGMSGSVDVDGSVTVTGGTIVALGGVCRIPSGNSVNTYVSSGTSFAAGDYRLVDASGNVIFSFTLQSGYSSCWIASDAFVLNGSYAVEKDGSVLLSWTQSSSTEGSYQGNYGGFGGHGRR